MGTNFQSATFVIQVILRHARFVVNMSGVTQKSEPTAGAIPTHHPRGKEGESSGKVLRCVQSPIHIAKQLGDEITIRRFIRFQVGESFAA